MQVHKTERFFAELEMIIDFIAQDSWTRAEQFNDALSDTVMNLPHFPYKCRQSKKSNDENLRELVFNGYVIPYRINKTQDRIEIFGIFSENEWTL